jgi:hypothetical protein
MGVLGQSQGANEAAIHHQQYESAIFPPVFGNQGFFRRFGVD